MTSISPLSSTDRSLVGGKAAGLATLARLGLEVPRGFVITRRALEAAVEIDLDLTEQGCARLQETIRRAAVPGEVFEAVRGLRAPLAVRSSVTVEDSQIGAFAGVYHTELGVRPAGIGNAIRECWARAFSFEAVSHALANNIDPRTIGVAVVVQELVEADRAGALFTMDPSGHAPDTAVVSFSRGLGDRLLSGETAGDTIRLPRGRRPIDPVLRELLRIGLRLEKRLGHPQDIEWVETRGRLLFLQTRPISTVESPRGIVWTRALSEERFPTPISPLGWSALETVLPVNLVTLERRFGLKARRPNDVARTIRHYVYSNEKFFSIPGSLRPNPLAQLRFWRGYLREAVDVLRNAPGAIGRLGLLALTRLFRAFLFPHATEIRSSWDGHLAQLLSEMDAFDRVDPSGLSPAGLRRHRIAMEEVARRYMEPDLAIYVVKMAASWMLAKLGGDLPSLTAGLAENRTLRMNEELEQVARSLDDETRTLLAEERYDEIEPNAALRRFLDRNGHTTTNWDLREATWGEDPTKVLRMLRSTALASRRKSIHRTREVQQTRQRVARERLSAQLPSWLSGFSEETLRILHDFMRIDEEHHFYCSRLFRPMRKLYREFGERLVRTGALGTIDDVWFLTIPEIENALENPFSRRELARVRRAGFERSRTTRPPDRFLDQKPLTEDAAVAGPVLRGVGASPGVVVGVVRVVEGSEEIAALRPGEILVTPSPNPAWTPAYAVAGGLVTATGSVLSHGLVSAREYHLPAVIGVPVRNLVTGQRVRVDGDRGTVTVEETE